MMKSHRNHYFPKFDNYITRSSTYGIWAFKSAEYSDLILGLYPGLLGASCIHFL